MQVVGWRHRLTGLTPFQQAAVICHHMKLIPSPERIQEMASAIVMIGDLAREAAFQVSPNARTGKDDDEAYRERVD